MIMKAAPVSKKLEFLDKVLMSSLIPGCVIWRKVRASFEGGVTGFSRISTIRAKIRIEKMMF